LHAGIGLSQIDTALSASRCERKQTVTRACQLLQNGQLQPYRQSPSFSLENWAARRRLKMHLNIQKFRDAPLNTDPYEFLAVTDFVEKQALDDARAVYPEVPGPGSHPSPGLRIEGAFSDLIEQLRGPEFQAAVEENSTLT
jgi:hypothetical protein